MTTQPSLETLELRAAGALRLDGDERRALRLADALPDHPVAFPDTRDLAAAAHRSMANDPWRATLLAEAYVTGARRRPWLALHRSLPEASVRLRKGETGVPWEGVPTVLETERDATRRERIRATADATVAHTHPAARDVVDALRTATGNLDATLVHALGLGDDGHGDLLDATDDLLRELDAWVCRGLELDPAHLTWADRLRTLAGHATLTALPAPTWVELGARPFERLGFDEALRGVANALRPAATDARGVAVIVSAPGERCVLAGRAPRAGSGAAEVLGAVAEAVSVTLGRGVFPGVRRGCDRSLDGLANALGRRLLLEPGFLRREAAVDAVPRERVMLECLHAELLRLRLDVALSRFNAHVLARRPDAGVRLHDELRRAWGTSPPPAWGPWVAAVMFDGSGAWSARPAARVTGARLEALVRDELRARFDEDWYRNPKAAAALRGVFDEIRATGVRGWCEARKRTLDAAATTTRFAEALREARRGL